MTTVTDLIHDVTNYLVTQCKQSTSLGASALAPVLVIDGPIVNRDHWGSAPLRLAIGYDAISGNPELGTAAQRWPFLGASGNYREETGAITCTAEAFSGDLVPADVRGSCKAIVGAVEIMLRGAPTTGPGDTTMGGLVQWSQIDAFTWTQAQTENGYSAACVFRVTYLARLAP